MSLQYNTVIAYRLALIIALIAILYLATTETEYAYIEAVSDRLTHSLAFLFLAFLTDFSFPGSRFGPGKIIALLGYGLVIEVIQYFLPYRECSIIDLLVDAIGITTYVCCMPLLHHVPLFRSRWHNGKQTT